MNDSMGQSKEGQQKPTGKIKKIFNTSSWSVFVALLPVTVLILLSQNTIPGDLFYPVKRGMENVILAAASASPATKVAFRTDLTERRFDEAEKLLLARADITGLSDFVKEVQTTQQEVSTLSNPESKKESTEKLIKKIDEYQNKLVQIQAKPQYNQVEPSLLTPTTKIFLVKPSPTSVMQKVTRTSSQQIISPKPTDVETLSTASITPTSVAPTTEASPTQIQIEPTITISPNPPSDNMEAAIDDTQRELEEIKNELKNRQRDEIKKEKKIKEEEKSTEEDIKIDEGKREKNKGKK